MPTSMNNKLLKQIKQERKNVSRLYGSSSQSMTDEALCKMVWDMVPNKILVNPKSYYLDYACGKGTILLYGIEVLFQKLQKVISDPKIRLNHIITQQLFGYDIDKSQIDITRSAFKRILKEPKANINIECENSLNKDFKKMNKKFNLVTNVPFQNGKDTNYFKKFRVGLNDRLGTQLNYKIIISPNFLTLTSKDNNKSHLAIYKDLGNAFENITLPAGVCVTREDPNETEFIEFTDLKGNTSIIEKNKFVVVADNSVLKIIEKIKEGPTLGPNYIHDSNNISEEKEDLNGTVFYVDKAGETNKPVKGFLVDGSEGVIRSGSFALFAYNAPGDPLDVGNKRLGPVKILKNGDYIFSDSVVAIQLQSDIEVLNCKLMLECEFIKKIIRSVKYATNNSKSLINILPKIDFTKDFNEDDLIDKFK
jgi:hypothetical protein